MEENSYATLDNEAIIMLPRGSHASLRMGKSPPSCTGSRRRKGQPVKRRIVECDEESCNSSITDTDDHVDRSARASCSMMSTADVQESKCDSSSCSASSSLSSGYNPASASLQLFKIEPTTFAVNPSTIVVDSSNNVVSSSNSEIFSTARVKESLRKLMAEECPPDPIPNVTHSHKLFGGTVNQNPDAKTTDELEVLRLLIMLVGPGNCDGQAAVPDVFSDNPPLNLSTAPFSKEQYRCDASTTLPSSENFENQMQTVFTTVLNNAQAMEALTSAVSSKTYPSLSVNWTKADRSSGNSPSEALSILSSFISRLAADSTNCTDIRTTEKKCKESNHHLGCISTIPPQSSPRTSLVSPLVASDFIAVTRPEISTEMTPENLLTIAEEQANVCIRSTTNMMPKKINECGKNGVLNPLSLTARPVSQWNHSDANTMLNSPIFREFPRLSFRPHIKRKLFDEFSASTSSTQNSRPEIDDLEGFAQHFKKQRIKLGYTQGDVGLALGRKYGTDFSQTTISRFEAMNLSFKNMCKLRPLLKEWLEGQEAAVANGTNVEELRIEITKDRMEDCVDELPIHRPPTVEPLMKRRRKRTNLDLSQRKSLDNFFLANPRPGHEEMVQIANALDLERDVVRVWFCNRRQKLRRSEDLFPMIHSPCRTRVKKSYPIGLPNDTANVTLGTGDTTTNLY